MYSLIIPVYKNEASIPALLEALKDINQQLENALNVTFVVDGSPDQSYALLKENLPNYPFQSRLLMLSRNFGPYAAIRAGLENAQGPFFGIMAADLQEPPELMVQCFKSLAAEPVDVVFARREGRDDPLSQKIPSQLFWNLYRTWVQKEMPLGGVDVFACNEPFREHLLSLKELNSSFIGLAVWLGFRRKFIGYQRQKRHHGKSTWSLGKKIKYAMDSLFAFSDLPIKLLYFLGVLGIGAAMILGSVILWAKLFGNIPVSGYATTIMTILFFAALNAFGLGVIGSYVWRTFENTKLRPQSIVLSSTDFSGTLRDY